MTQNEMESSPFYSHCSVGGGVSAYLAKTSFYTSEQFLQLAPGYWLPFIPVIITVSLVTLVKSLRDGLRKFFDLTPEHWLTAIHLVHILALGSLIKASTGDFPQTFASYVGILDLVFGLSALPVTWLAHRRPYSRSHLGTQNILIHRDGMLRSLRNFLNESSQKIPLQNNTQKGEEP